MFYLNDKEVIDLLKGMEDGSTTYQYELEQLKKSVQEWLIDKANKLKESIEQNNYVNVTGIKQTLCNFLMCSVFKKTSKAVSLFFSLIQPELISMILNHDDQVSNIFRLIINYQYNNLEMIKLCLKHILPYMDDQKRQSYLKSLIEANSNNNNVEIIKLCLQYILQYIWPYMDDPTKQSYLKSLIEANNKIITLLFEEPQNYELPFIKDITGVVEEFTGVVEEFISPFTYEEQHKLLHILKNILAEYTESPIKKEELKKLFNDSSEKQSMVLLKHFFLQGGELNLRILDATNPSDDLLKSFLDKLLTDEYKHYETNTLLNILKTFCKMAIFYIKFPIKQFFKKSFIFYY